MGIVRITRFALACDGCDADSCEGDGCRGNHCRETFGFPDGFASEMEARVAAQAVGWSFPALASMQEGSRGRPRTICSEACPKCLPAWRQKRKRRRLREATDAEMREES